MHMYINRFVNISHKHRHGNTILLRQNSRFLKGPTDTNLLKLSPFPRPQVLDPDWSVRDAGDGLDLVSDSLKHAADLPVLPLSDDDVYGCHLGSPVVVHHLHNAGPSATSPREKSTAENDTQRKNKGGRE